MSNREQSEPDIDVRFFLHKQGTFHYCYGNRWAFRLSDNFIIQEKRPTQFALCDNSAFLHPAWSCGGYFYGAASGKLYRFSFFSIEELGDLEAPESSIFVRNGELFAGIAAGYAELDHDSGNVSSTEVYDEIIAGGEEFFPLFDDLVVILPEQLFYIRNSEIEEIHHFQSPAAFASGGLYVDAAGYLVDVLSGREHAPTCECDVEMLRFYYGCYTYCLVPDATHARDFWEGFDLEQHCRFFDRRERLYIARRSRKLSEAESSVL